MSVQDGGCLFDIFIQAARASGDLCLIAPDLTVDYLISQTDRIQIAMRIRLQLADGYCVGRMERQSDHRLDLGQIQLHHVIVVSPLLRLQGEVLIATTVIIQVGLCLAIGGPNGGQAGGLGRHDIDADALVHGQSTYTGTGEFQDHVFNGAKQIFTHQKGHIVRADTFSKAAGHIDQHDLWFGDVVGISQQLFDQFGSALAHGDRAQSAVAGVAVRTKDHFAAAGHSLSGILVDDCLTGRYVNSAVFFGSRQAEYMVVLVDRPANRAQTVMAVGQHVGKRKRFHAASPSRLNDAHVGDIVRKHPVKMDMERIPVVLTTVIVTVQDPVGHCLFAALSLFFRFRGTVFRNIVKLRLRIPPPGAFLVINHWYSLFSVMTGRSHTILNDLIGSSVVDQVVLLHVDGYVGNMLFHQSGRFLSVMPADSLDDGPVLFKHCLGPSRFFHGPGPHTLGIAVQLRQNPFKNAASRHLIDQTVEAVIHNDQTVVVGSFGIKFGQIGDLGQLVDILRQASDCCFGSRPPLHQRPDLIDVLDIRLADAIDNCTAVRP